MNLRDDSEFNKWKREMDDKEEIERLEHVATMKIDMELCREEAMKAQKNKMKQNHVNAEKMKVQRDKREVQMHEEKQENLEKKVAIVEVIHD